MSNYQKPQRKPPDSIGRNVGKIQKKRERTFKKRVTYQEKINSLRKANVADGYENQWTENEKDESQKKTRGSYSEKRRRLMEADLSQLSDPVLSTTTAAPVMTKKVESERWTEMGWNQTVKRKREDDGEEMQRKRIREEERGTNAVPFISTTGPCSGMNREAENFSSLSPEVSSVEGPGDQPSTAGLSTSPTSVPLITLSNDDIDELRKYGPVYCCDFLSDVQPTKFQDSEPDDCIDASLLDAQLRELLYQASLVLC